MNVPLPWSIPFATCILWTFLHLISGWDDSKLKNCLMSHLVWSLSSTIIFLLLWYAPTEKEKNCYNQRLMSQKASWDQTHDKPWKIDDLLYK